MIFASVIPCSPVQQFAFPLFAIIARHTPDWILSLSRRTGAAFCTASLTAREAAIVNRIDSKVGTLEAGKEADVIVVDGNPIDDLNVLSKVKMTFVRGNRLV